MREEKEKRRNKDGWVWDAYLTSRENVKQGVENGTGAERRGQSWRYKPMSCPNTDGTYSQEMVRAHLGVQVEKRRSSFFFFF